MSEVDRIQEQLRNAVNGDAWHGPGLRELIEDLDALEAAARPIPEAHTPWEIVLHVTVWIETVRRRLEGERVEWNSADWPPVSDPGEGAWTALLKRLEVAHETLQAKLARMSDPHLRRSVVGQEYDAYFMIHGLIQHTLYHAGQIAILTKPTRASRASE